MIPPGGIHKGVLVAKVTAKPHQHIVDWFKGTLDYYEWMGIVCVRKWPHWPKRKPTPAEKDAQDTFAYITRAWRDLDPYIKERCHFTARGTNYTPRDMFTRLYLRGLES